mgnify:CR=1 FL=1
MKKIVALVMITAIMLGMPSMTFANNGRGKGLATAPGQSENFSKGITTVVTLREVTIESEDIDIGTSEYSIVEAKFETTVVTNLSEEQVKVYHENAHNPGSNQAGWYRYDTIKTTVITTTTLSWDETTTITETTTTVIPIITIETIETTLQHRGAPGSNGEVLGETSRTISSVSTEGKPVVTTETTTEVTIGEVTTTTNSATYSDC